MERIFTTCIYENPLPQLRAIHSAFPHLCRLPDGRILAAHQMGQAFESVDGTTWISESADGGRTWSPPWRAFPRRRTPVPMTDCAKLTLLPDGRLLALGYEFFRPDPDLPLGNPETGGLLDDQVYYALSSDDGRNWSEHVPIRCAWGNHVEASAPVTVLQDGSWAAPITGFPRWDGRMTGPRCGRLLRSFDQGQTWDDDVICMAFSGDVTCYEQRMCQLDDGTLVVIGWNEDTATGALYNNHYTVSTDGGRHFSEPRDTGVRGQASSVCALGGTRLLALHALRRDTDRPGIYGFIVDARDGGWNIEECFLVWEPERPVVRDPRMAGIFAFLKFGQPGAIRLEDGRVLVSHWVCEEGLYKTCATCIRL